MLPRKTRLEPRILPPLSGVADVWGPLAVCLELRLVEAAHRPVDWLIPEGCESVLLNAHALRVKTQLLLHYTQGKWNSVTEHERAHRQTSCFNEN